MASPQVVLLLSLAILAQSPTHSRPPSASGATAQARSGAAPQDSSAARIERAYRDILEKTNEQLSLWSNPYGVMVGALGVLFTVAAVVVGFLIFRQGSDYRSLIERSIREYQGILNSFIEGHNKQIELLKASVTEKIATLSQELEAASGKQKKEIETKIVELERLSTALKPHELPRTRETIVGPTPSWLTNLGFGQASASTIAAINQLYRPSVVNSTHKCSRCGTSFTPSGVKVGLLGSGDVTCSKCGQVDPIIG